MPYVCHLAFTHWGPVQKQQPLSYLLQGFNDHEDSGQSLSRAWVGED